MPRKPPKQFTAWSYSRLTQFEQCPLKAKLSGLDRIREPKTKALQRGIDVHKDAEDYIRGKKKKLPKSLMLFDEEFKDLRANNYLVQTEVEMAFDKTWDPTEWFAPDAHIRIKADAMYDSPVEPNVRTVIDFKTGKIREGYGDQLELYAIGAFETAPGNITKVFAELWYLDQGEIKDLLFERKDVPKLMKKWEKRARPMLNAVTFRPKPSRLCGWCYYSQKNKGLCKY